MAGRAGGGPFGLSWSDLDDAVHAGADDLASLGSSRVLVTGATGFLGRWLVSSLVAAKDRLGLGLDIAVLSRHGARTDPALAGRLEVIEADVRSLPDLGHLDVVVHGAAPSVVRGADAAPGALGSTIVSGTASVLDAAQASGARVCVLSSGAVYGSQPAPVGEDAAPGAFPDGPGGDYARAKREAEALCEQASAEGRVEVVIARLFSFVGPGIALDAHFAAGNFLGDVSAGRPVLVRGNGEARRSYLYTGDLPAWIWALVARGTSGRAYNVGSPEPVSIAALAHRVAGLVEPRARVEIAGEIGAGATWYVPVTTRAEHELGLRPRTGLDEALARTYRYLTGPALAG